MKTYRLSIVMLLTFPCWFGAAGALAEEEVLFYPSYRGDGSGAPPPQGVKLVSNAEQAKVLWRSEEQIPALTKTTCIEFPGACGHAGFSSPIVGHNRVYITYWKATGPLLERTDKGKTKVQIDADEVVVCMDINTGKTIWRTAYQSGGWNYVGVYHSDGQITPTLGGGRLYFLGTLGRAYCLDAETGEKIWDKPTGRYAKLSELAKADVMAGKLKPIRGQMPPKATPSLLERLDRFADERQMREQGGSGGRSFNSSPVVLGEVVIFSAIDELIAYEAATGKELWRKQGCMGSKYSPAPLTLGDKQYVITTPGGHVIDATNGTVVDRVACTRRGACTPATSGPYVITNITSGDSSTVACLQLTERGLKEIWRLPDGISTGLNSPVIMNKRVFLQLRVKRGWVNLPDSAKQRLLPAGYSGPELQTKGKFTRIEGVGGGEDLILLVDLASGKSLGVNAASTINSLGSMPFGMEDRFFYGSRAMFASEPDQRGILPALKGFNARTRPTRCCSFAGKAGLLFTRVDAGPELVRCYDLRMP